MRKILLSTFVMCTHTLIIVAQNMTSSPTSMFGLGEITTGEGGQYGGMGGVGIALRENNLLNITNPASLTELQQQHFFFDLGVAGNYQRYSQSGKSSHTLNGNLNNFTVGCRITPRWYGAIFMAPVSSVGYAITLEQDIAGTNSTTASSLFEGEGGLSKMGISTAYQLWKELSLGTNLSYVGGTITQAETQGTALDQTSSYKHTFYADFGLQYKWTIDREQSFVTGLVYGYSQAFKQDNDHSVSSSSTSGSIEENAKRYRTCLPQFLGLGVSYSTLRWSATAEYKLIDWSRMESSRSNVKFKNQHQIKIGGSYTIGNVYKNPIKLLLGTGMSDSYIIIQNQKATQYYLSTGLNMGFHNRNSISLGMKYTGQMKVSPGRQREQGVSLFFNITFAEKTYRAKIR